jgi:hypothetical protein
MNEMFKKGDKVICNDATGYLVKGQTYTVKEAFGIAETVSITVEECSEQEGYGSYKIHRFSMVNKCNHIVLTDNEVHLLIDAFIALDFFSEGTYINLNGLSIVISNVQNQVDKDN